MSEPKNSFNESDYQQMLDTMFREQDEQLWQKLREQIDEEERVNELSKAIGIQDKQLIEKLLKMGVRARSIAALTVYPLVSVAYADGVLNVEERDLIMKSAEAWNMKPGDPGHQVLEQWLASPPTDEGFAAWKSYMQAVLQQMTPQQQAEMKQTIMDRSNAVANAVGDVLGRFGNRTTAGERKRLAEIEAVFP